MRAAPRLDQLVRHNPRDVLAEDLGLEVDALDGNERPAQGVGAHAVGLKLEGQLPGHTHRLVGDAVLVRRRQGREEEDHRQRVVHVPEQRWASGRLLHVVRRRAAGESAPTAACRRCAAAGVGDKLRNVTHLIASMKDG